MLIDLYRLFLQYLPVIAIGLPLMFWLYREIRTERQWRVIMLAVLMVACIIAGLFLATGYPVATRYTWSGGRLAPAIAWVKGYRLYYPPGEGPIFVQMYGPVSAMVYAISGVASHPTTAILIGAVVNSAFYFFPAAWLLKCSRRGQSTLMAVAGLVMFILITSRHFVLWNTAMMVTIDAPAAGFAACAFAVLAKCRIDRMWMTGAACGMFAALSIWTKLTFAPITLALVLYAALITDWRGALRFAASMTLIIAAISGFFVILFGTELLVQNITVPSRQPWTRSHWRPLVAYVQGMYEMWQYSLPIGCILIVAVLLRLKLPVTDGGRKEWASQNPWLLPTFGAILVLPTATLAYVKIGGIWNNAAASSYLALLAAAAALSSACGPRHDATTHISARSRLARTALVTVMVAGCWVEFATLKELPAKLALWTELKNNDHEIAYNYALKHPGEVYFPGYPLSTLLAEGHLYHFAAGIESLGWAGFQVSDEHFNAWLPARLREVVFYGEGPRPMVLPRMRDFVEEHRNPELPGWIVLTR